MDFLIERFWCCLAPPEKGAFQLVQAQYTLILPFVLKSVFDAYWFAFGGGSASLRRETFIRSYGLTETTITPEGSPEITVYLMDGELWSLIADYVRDPANECGAPCRILTFPN